jgi:hypothetical protein
LCFEFFSNFSNFFQNPKKNMPRSYSSSTTTRKRKSINSTNDDGDGDDDDEYGMNEEEEKKTSSRRSSSTTTNNKKTNLSSSKPTNNAKRTKTTTTSTTKGKKNLQQIDDDEDNVPIMEYNDVHRILVQMFMQKKVMTQKEAQQVIDNALRERNITTPLPFQQAFSTINEQLVPLHLKLANRLGVEFESTPMQFALVNTRKDDIAKLFTPLDESQLNIFKVTLILIVKSPDGFTTFEEIKSEYKNLTGTGKADKDILNTLELLAHDKWLLPGERKGFYTVGARSLMELNETLETLGAMEDSELKQIVIKTKHYMTWKNGKLASTTTATTTTTTSSAAAPPTTTPSATPAPDTGNNNTTTSIENVKETKKELEPPIQPSSESKPATTTTTTTKPTKSKG